MQHMIIFYRRLRESQAFSQTSFHLENIVNISRQWSQRAPRQKCREVGGPPSAGGPMTWHNWHNG